MSAYKIVVTGPFNSGKTQFVETASEIPVVKTEKNITTEDRGIKAETTVAMDFGRVSMDGETVHLFGTPGQTRFSFMWEILASEMNGFIVLVDSTDPPSFPDAAELIDLFSSFVDVPYIIVANKMDQTDRASLEDVRDSMKAGAHVTVMECNALDSGRVRDVLAQMMRLIKG